MTVGELLQRISADELTEWMAYERIAGPLGPDRGDYQAGVIAATIANVNRKKNSRKYRPADFIPRWMREAAKTPEQMRTKLIELTRLFGGTVLGEDGKPVEEGGG